MRALIEFGKIVSPYPEFLHDTNKSLFVAVLCCPAPENILEELTWLFGSLWDEAVKKYSPAHLLTFTSPQRPKQGHWLAYCIPHPSVVKVCKRGGGGGGRTVSLLLLSSNGDQWMCEPANSKRLGLTDFRDESGNNILGLRPTRETLENLLPFVNKVPFLDWKHENDFEYNALERFALYLQSDELDLLLTKLTDKEFAYYATPFIWGRYEREAQKKANKS